MKRRHAEIEEDDDLILSDSEAEELEQDLRVYLQSRGKGRPERVLQNNIIGLNAKIDEMKLLDQHGQALPWVEILVVDTDAPLEVKDVNDDLARETVIYNSTLANVLKAITRCEEQGIKYQRPDDYYAEMLKSDDHMLKLNDSLLADKRRKEERNKAVQERQMKKYAKKVQVETHLRRQKQKSEDLAVVKEWRRQQKRGDSEPVQFPEELLDPKNAKRKEILSKNPVKDPQLQKSGKRKAKDAKYGNGGNKRFKKDNDVTSSADMSSFSKRRNTSTASGGSFGAARKPGTTFGARGKKAFVRRPGKDSRRKSQ